MRPEERGAAAYGLVEVLFGLFAQQAGWKERKEWPHSEPGGLRA